jgi:hypothetical protein
MGSSFYFAAGLVASCLHLSSKEVCSGEGKELMMLETSRKRRGIVRRDIVTAMYLGGSWRQASIFLTLLDDAPSSLQTDLSLHPSVEL